MAYLAAMDRFQTRITSLEEVTYKDNIVRFVDAFVDTIDQVGLYEKQPPKN